MARRREHDREADAQAVREAGLETLGRKALASKLGWPERRARNALDLIKASQDEPAAFAASHPSDQKSKRKQPPTPEELLERAASDELTVPFSNWLGKGWYREAGEPQPVYETDDDGEMQLVGYEADPGILWPDGYSGPKHSDELFIDNSVPKPRDIAWGVMFTCAQAETPVHGPAFMNLCALAGHYDLTLIVGGITYGKSLFQSIGKTKALRVAPWSSCVADYVTRERLEDEECKIQFAAEMNTRPTAANPLTGMFEYCRAKTTIFPFPRQDMVSLPRHKNDPQLFARCSGAITVPNYILMKAGLKAMPQHTIGAVLVIGDTVGNVFTRNVVCDPDTGDLFDLDLCVTGGVVRRACDVIEERGLERPVLAVGCTHHRFLNDACGRAIWGYRGMPSGDAPVLDVIRPSRQVLNDVLDSNSISHHDRHDPWRSYAKRINGRDDISAEIADVADFLNDIERDDCETWVTYSNHDDHFARWLRDTDWRDDPTNAEMYLEANLAQVQAIRGGEDFSVFKWALERCDPQPNFRLSDADTPTRFIKYYYNLHGDKNPNGGRGSTEGLRKMGILIAKAHDHQGTVSGQVVSLFSLLDYPPYAVGPSSWARGFGIEQPDGSMQMVPLCGDKWRP